MGRISAGKFGLSMGLVFMALHAGGGLLFVLFGREKAIFFFNSIFYGIDITPLVRNVVPDLQVLTGIIGMFALGWVIGAGTAYLYNFHFQKQEPDGERKVGLFSKF